MGSRQLRRFLRLQSSRHLDVIVIDILGFAIMCHMPRRKVQTVVRHGLHREVIKADRLFCIAATINLSYEHFLSQVVIVEIAPHRLSIVHFKLSAQRLFKLVIVKPMAILIPLTVHILHVAIKAAKFSEEFRLV